MNYYEHCMLVLLPLKSAAPIKSYSNAPFSYIKLNVHDEYELQLKSAAPVQCNAPFSYHVITWAPAQVSSSRPKDC